MIELHANYQPGISQLGSSHQHQYRRQSHYLCAWVDLCCNL